MQLEMKSIHFNCNLLSLPLLALILSGAMIFNWCFATQAPIQAYNIAKQCKFKWKYLYEQQQSALIHSSAMIGNMYSAPGSNQPNHLIEFLFVFGTRTTRSTILYWVTLCGFTWKGPKKPLKLFWCINPFWGDDLESATSLQLKFQKDIFQIADEKLSHQIFRTQKGPADCQKLDKFVSKT